MNPHWNLYTILPHESLLNLCASKASQNSTWTLTEICTQSLRTNPYWICGHLKLVKIRPEALLNFVHNFPRESLLNLWASKTTPSSTEFLTEICTIFPHKSLLNLWASKASQNSTEFLNEMCKQFCCMNPYWICEHLKLIKIVHKSFLEKVEIFPHESLLNLWASKGSKKYWIWVVGKVEIEPVIWHYVWNLSDFTRVVVPR